MCLYMKKIQKVISVIVIMVNNILILVLLEGIEPSSWD